MKTPRSIILYIAVSLDGYIAKTGDDLSFLSRVKLEGEDYGYSDFIRTVDTVIMGRRTYDWILGQVPEFIHADLDTWIITHTPRPPAGNVRFYTGSLKELVLRLKSTKGRNIFIDGGAEIVNILLRDKLIDEFYISIVPVLLGEGIRLFDNNRPEQVLTLAETLPYPSGLVTLHYVAS